MDEENGIDINVYIFHMWKTYMEMLILCKYNIVIISVQYHPPTWIDSHNAWWWKLLIMSSITITISIGGRKN